MIPIEHFQVSLIVHNLIFILIGFAGVAIATFSSPRGPRSKTLCVVLCWILAGGGIVGMVATSAEEIKGLESMVRYQGDGLKQYSKEIRHRRKQIREMNENAQQLLGQLVAQGGLSQENKIKIDATLVPYEWWWRYNESD